MTMQSSSNLPVFGYRDGYVSIVERTLTLPGHVMVVVTMLIELRSLDHTHKARSPIVPRSPRFQPSLHHINTFTATIAPVSWSSPRSLQHSHATPYLDKLHHRGSSDQTTDCPAHIVPRAATPHIRIKKRLRPPSPIARSQQASHNMQTAISLQTRNFRLKAASSAREAAPQAASSSQAQDPLLLRALRGEKVERPPVWMMRQAGRYMKVYQDMCKVHKTFRERSENADLAVEVSLQPWRAFQPDGVILFSDILTPITGMNIPFDILASKGPVIFDPIRTQKQVDAVTELVRLLASLAPLDIL